MSAMLYLGFKNIKTEVVCTLHICKSFYEHIQKKFYLKKTSINFSEKRVKKDFKQ